MIKDLLKLQLKDSISTPWWSEECRWLSNDSVKITRWVINVSFHQRCLIGFLSFSNFILFRTEQYFTLEFAACLKRRCFEQETCNFDRIFNFRKGTQDKWRRYFCFRNTTAFIYTRIPLFNFFLELMWLESSENKVFVTSGH